MLPSFCYYSQSTNHHPQFYYVLYSPPKSNPKLQIQICQIFNKSTLPHLTIPPRISQKKQEMQPISSHWGLPICLSGNSRPLLMSQEMEDHERRREIIKKKKFQEHLQLLEMIRAQNRAASGNGGESRERDVSGKRTVVSHEFSCISLPCTARAA